MASRLFDEAFSYSLDANSGFGWEDIEMGYRLYRLGAKISFSRTAVSVTQDPPTGSVRPGEGSAFD
ncbi:hypothetical protein [Azospirillum sp. TSH58]|uniref:hypothetical protein n=1 Tax=Azospirillum sp. TSH58 TaxID=664962 RepID=UPI001FFF0B70|nr:hypothetical protein [Azospirillum sp. TSH58]